MRRFSEARPKGSRHRVNAALDRRLLLTPYGDREVLAAVAGGPARPGRYRSV